MNIPRTSRLQTSSRLQTLEIGNEAYTVDPVTGKKEGQYLTFHPNGQIETVGYYSKGEPEGVWKIFNNEGVRVVDIPFKNGKRNGIITTYYLNGNISEQIEYLDGVQYGFEATYDKQGNQLSEGMAINFRRVGVWDYWTDGVHNIVDYGY